ncbi:MAG: hypothetical protein ACFFCS_15675, partial [Candidatus Hodarchaeota archaeon]
ERIQEIKENDKVVVLRFRHYEDFKISKKVKKPGEEDIDKQNLEPNLVSSGLVGITQLMQEILKGKKIIRAIDHYSKKVLLEQGKEIIVALIVMDDLRVLRDKLRKFIEEFEIEYNEDLENFQGMDFNKFNSTKVLIKKYFDVKYLKL